MPYKRRYKKKNYSRAVVRYRPHPKTELFLAKKAWQMGKKALSLLNVEYKVIENSLSDSPTTTPLLTFLSATAQGTTNSTREGDSIKMTRLSFSGLYRVNTSGNRASLRIILVKDKQTNGSQFSMSDLLEITSVPLQMVSHYNLDNKFRFDILYDRVHHVEIGGNESLHIKFNKILNDKIRYGGNANTVADVNTIGYTLVTIGTTTSNNPTIDWSCRLRFIDN